ncbi:hypothetical protein GLOIN_2v1447817 [Rhizophagus clarus]|uniref:88 kDa immunoreactive mannoprotein mp88 n=1 Tax=Rhizophagus clarus TaxID=94130 RepID=A0A8H3QBM8_9GLOM|nr:hypothetical protein GLOIN_2v1447817 [Rhizophagus clarus]
MVKVSLLLFALAAIASTNAAVVRRQDPSVQVTVESEQLFCSFLPKTPGEEIGASEGDAIPFCTQANPPNAPNAQAFPAGFIKTAHFASVDGKYVQVTGTIDPSAYQLSTSDGGGQYDSVGAPPGATCANSEKFVNLVEPDIGRFCIRCCQDASQCDTSRSTDGCEKIIPGDYS